MVTKSNQEYIDIQRIVEEKKLVAFILGEEEYSTILQLQDDYTRWKLLEEYYRSLAPFSNQKTEIIETVIGLFFKPAAKEKFASLELTRLLQIKEIEPVIYQNVQTGEFKSLPSNIQEELLYISTKLQLTSVKLFVVEMLRQGKKLDDFLLWNSTPLYAMNIIGKESLWCMSVLEEYYLQANVRLQNNIIEQLKPLISKYPKIRAVMNAYLTNNSRNNQFHLSIKEILDSK